MKIQTKQLNKNIADSLRILLNCKDSELIQVARHESLEEKKELLKALDVLGVYYYQKRQFPNSSIPTPEFAFYIPYVDILDDPIISDKYNYFYEEKRIYEEEQEQKTLSLQEMINQRWKEFTTPQASAQISLAASSQSGDEILRNSGHGGILFCTCTFVKQGEPVQGLKLTIRRVNNKIRCLLTGNSELKKQITSLNMDGQSIPIENGLGEIDLAEVSSKLSPLYATDNTGKQYEIIIVLDDKNNEIK